MRIQTDLKKNGVFKVNMLNGTPIMLDIPKKDVDEFCNSSAAFWSVTSNGATIYINARNIESIEEIYGVYN